MANFVDVVFNDMLEALKKEELGNKILLTYDKPNSPFDPDDLISDIDDVFDDNFRFAECLLMYDAYDYETGGLAKCQH